MNEYIVHQSYNTATGRNKPGRTVELDKQCLPRMPIQHQQQTLNYNTETTTISYQALPYELTEHYDSPSSRHQG
jgi:hypothetical protein